MLELENLGEQFVFYLDHIAPKLGVNQQTVYLFVLGEAYRQKQNPVTFSMKSDRRKMGLGTGDASKPMAENTVRECVSSLSTCGLFEIIDSGRFGTRVRVVLPLDAARFYPEPAQTRVRSIQDIDFFNEPLAREALLAREGYQCFYCARSLTDENYVIEHVVSRPTGDNSFRNLVAACQVCNNRKSHRNAADFFRTLYREGFLSEAELTDSQAKLIRLLDGKLIPVIDDSLLNQEKNIF
jgi:hypothetical protein